MTIKEGDIVNYHTIIGGPVTSTGHVVMFIFNPFHGGDTMAWLSGKSAWVSIEALSRPKCPMLSPDDTTILPAITTQTHSHP